MKTSPLPVLKTASAHFGPSGNGVPYVSDGDSARVLFFANLSGAYNGNAGISQCKSDMEEIVKRCNLHCELVDEFKRLYQFACDKVHGHDSWPELVDARELLAKVQA